MMRTYMGSSGGKSRLLGLIDPAETYGPHVVELFLRECAPYETILDIGAGEGRDLGIARRICPQSKEFAIEVEPSCVARLRADGVDVRSLDLETGDFPFAQECLDVIIANQVLEHVKELFWVMHEITKSLRVGGHCLIGVPNVASLHNRVGLLFGKHPTQAKACSAHVRCFSKNDFLLFLRECFPGGYILKAFAGSQFYPFPKAVARLFCQLAPSCANTIFFLLEKRLPYQDSFAVYPRKAHLETNFRSLETTPNT